jgi:hypothetical protein
MYLTHRFWSRLYFQQNKSISTGIESEHKHTSHHTYISILPVRISGKYAWLVDVERADMLSDSAHYVEAERGYIRALNARGGLSYSHKRAILFSLARVQLASGKLELVEETLDTIIKVRAVLAVAVVLL